MTENQAENCRFCSIVSGGIPSRKVGETSGSISVLEINPVSRGHVLVIPKEHSKINEKLPEDISKTIQEVSKKMVSGLSPKDVMIAKTSLFGHEIVNLIPKYSDEAVNSDRHHASKEELEEVQGILTKEEKAPEKEGVKKEPVKKISKIKRISSKNTWLPRRIP